MKLVAHVYEDGRKASRVAANRAATLRDAVKRPIDIVIEDLSATGFGMSTAEDLPVGSLLHLRLTGINRRDVRVVRRFGLNYGCEFVPPLGERELGQALKAGSVVQAAFKSDEPAGHYVSAMSLHAEKFSPAFRVAVLVGAIAALWLVIIGSVEWAVR